MPAKNNAIARIQGTLTAGATSVTLKSKGDLFGTTYPFRCKIEQVDGNGSVLFREIVTVTNRVGNNLSITRATEPCPADDTAISETQTAFEFADDSVVTFTKTAQDFEDIDQSLTDLANNKLNISTYNQEKQAFAATSTGTDDYAATISGITSYINGQTFKIQADVANTGAATLNISSLGAKTLKKIKDEAFVDLVDNDIIANQIFWATYNSVEDVFQFSVDPSSPITTTVSNLQTGLIAGESITALDVIRKGNVDILEDKTKFFKSLANDTDKLYFYGIANTSGILDDNITGIFDGIASGFTGLDTIVYHSLPDIGQTSRSADFFASGTGTTGQTFTITQTSRLKSISAFFSGNSRVDYMRVRETGPSGTILTTSANKSIGTNAGVVNWTFPDEVIFTPGVYYFERVWVSGGTNCGLGGSEQSSPDYYTGGQIFVNGSTTGSIAHDAYFIVETEEGGGGIGNNVYLQDDGSIGKFPGTNEVIIGNIISDTEIELNTKLNGNTSNTATTGGVTLGNAVGYVILNIEGLGNKKIPYYDI